MDKESPQPADAAAPAAAPWSALAGRLACAALLAAATCGPARAAPLQPRAPPAAAEAGAPQGRSNRKGPLSRLGAAVMAPAFAVDALLFPDAHAVGPAAKAPSAAAAADAAAPAAAAEVRAANAPLVLPARGTGGAAVVPAGRGLQDLKAWPDVRCALCIHALATLVLALAWRRRRRGEGAAAPATEAPRDAPREPPLSAGAPGAAARGQEDVAGRAEARLAAAAVESALMAGAYASLAAACARQAGAAHAEIARSLAAAGAAGGAPPPTALEPAGATAAAAARRAGGAAARAEAAARGAGEEAGGAAQAYRAFDSRTPRPGAATASPFRVPRIPPPTDLWRPAAPAAVAAPSKLACALEAAYAAQQRGAAAEAVESRLARLAPGGAAPPAAATDAPAAAAPAAPGAAQALGVGDAALALALLRQAAAQDGADADAKARAAAPGGAAAGCPSAALPKDRLAARALDTPAATAGGGTQRPGTDPVRVEGAGDGEGSGEDSSFDVPVQVVPAAPAAAAANGAAAAALRARRAAAAARRKAALEAALRRGVVGAAQEPVDVVREELRGLLRHIERHRLGEAPPPPRGRAAPDALRTRRDGTCSTD
ncbi:MAG: hypothetical protein J3K34DRAFT_477644 [Monoraphidium minutum]|nr:MAG: hypothetical protein J3K34DRAFT_477644 [Monoraphidium minutum]